MMRRWSTSFLLTGLIALSTVGLPAASAAADTESPLPCNAQQPPSGDIGYYHKDVVDPNTGYTYRVPVDNPGDCVGDLGAPDPFIGTFANGTWTFNTPAVQGGFAAVPATIPAAACTSVIEYVARGTGEDLDEYGAAHAGNPAYQKYWSVSGLATDHGAGVIGNAVYNNLVASEPAGSVRLYSDYYPADDVVSLTDLASFAGLAQASVNAGVVRAVADLNNIRSSCPNSRLLVVGYSQGAVVLRRALASPSLSSAVASPNALVELFGDAEFQASEANQPGSAGYTPSKAAFTLLGGYQPNYGGFVLPLEPTLFDSAPTIPSRFAVASWCHDKDPVCQLNLGTTMDQHLTYGQEDGYAAGRYAAAYFATSAPPGESTLPAATAVPRAYSLGSSCVSHTPGTTEVRTVLDNTGSPTGNPVTYAGTVGYVDSGAITNVTGTGLTATVNAGSSTTWTRDLPFVLGHTTFLYRLVDPNVINPDAWTTSAHTTPAQAELYNGFFSTLC
jgi:hypothetical protein